LRPRTRILCPIAAAATLALGLAGCGGGDSGGASTAPVPAVASPAADLRVELERLLGAHAVLVERTMRAAAAGEGDAQAALAAAGASADEVAGVIATAAGDPALRARLARAWRAWDRALVAGPTAALDRDRDALAAVLSDAAPDVPADEAAALLENAEGALVEGLDASAQPGYEAAATLGARLAEALAAADPERLATGDTTPSALELRATLDRLLGEGALLRGDAMWALADRAPDARSLVAAADAAAAGLAGLVGKDYGPAAGNALLPLLSARAAAEAAVARAGGAPGGAAARRLDASAAPIAGLLFAANPGLRARAVTARLRAVDDALARSVALHRAGREAAALAALRLAQRRAVALGDAIAAATVAQFPERYAG
jgi:hypothetical protein